jgi:hypothetical protein
MGISEVIGHAAAGGRLSPVRVGVCAVLVLAGLTLAGCSDDPEPYYPPDADTAAVSTEYDPALEPSAAALALVPADATVLEVTDFDQLRLILGFGGLSSDSDEQERDRFWREAGDAPTFSDGLLRPVDVQLREEYGFSQDDVAWEAHYGAGEATEWIIAFHDDVRMDDVRRAVTYGVGPLEGAELDVDRHLASSAPPPAGEESWAAESDLHELVGEAAAATYVERGCLPFDTVFGAGMLDQLAEAPAARLQMLDPLEAFSVSFGGEVVTVRLGEDRSDAFDRLRIAEVMPRTRPEFGMAYGRGVADPSGGRLGFDLARPESAIELVEGRHLPFAVCADE